MHREMYSDKGSLHVQGCSICVTHLAHISLFEVYGQRSQRNEVEGQIEDAEAAEKDKVDKDFDPHWQPRLYMRR